MDNRYAIQFDKSAMVYELICRPGYGIDGQHYFYEDTRYEIYQLAKDVAPCDCADCQSQLAS